MSMMKKSGKRTCITLVLDYEGDALPKEIADVKLLDEVRGCRVVSMAMGDLLEEMRDLRNEISANMVNNDA